MTVRSCIRLGKLFRTNLFPSSYSLGKRHRIGARVLLEVDPAPLTAHVRELARLSFSTQLGLSPSIVI